MHPVRRCSERDQSTSERAARRNHRIGAAQLLHDALAPTAIGQRRLGSGHVQHHRKTGLLTQTHSRPAIRVRPGAEDRIRLVLEHQFKSGDANTAFERHTVAMCLEAWRCVIDRTSHLDTVGPRGGVGAEATDNRVHHRGPRNRADDAQVVMPGQVEKIGPVVKRVFRLGPSSDGEEPHDRLALIIRRSPSKREVVRRCGLSDHEAPRRSRTVLTV